jgi:transcriptional regulator with XRE-family HTH domain
MALMGVKNNFMKRKIINEKLIERMKELYDERGEPLNVIESAVGISTGSLSKYMSGIHLPNSEVVKRLARYWNVSADYLLGTGDNKTIYTNTTLPKKYVM